MEETLWRIGRKPDAETQQSPRFTLIPMSTKSTPSPIERLKFKDLRIDLKYSGRTQKEVNDNAKEKQAELAAAGGWSPAMPGQYFVDEGTGEKVLLAGFARVKACELNGEKEGYFVQANGDEIDHLLACETSNSTKPLSSLSRGARYSELAKGVVADDFKGTIADPKNPADWKRAPMTNAEIAERIGKTSEWVRRCIVLFDSPPEVRDLLESEKVAVKVVEKAKALVDKHHDGSEAKQAAICRKAFQFARQQDADKATEKHFDAIKDEFIPKPKLKADDGNTDTAPATKAKKPKPVESTENESEGQETGKESQEGPSEEPSLFSAPEVLQEGSAKNEKLQKALATWLLDTEGLEKLGITACFTNEEADIAAEEIIKIVANAAEVF